MFPSSITTLTSTFPSSVREDRILLIKTIKERNGRHTSYMLKKNMKFSKCMVYFRVLSYFHSKWKVWKDKSLDYKEDT